jgi:hypothetical protein
MSTKTLSQHTRIPGRDLKTRPFEFESYPLIRGVWSESMKVSHCWMLCTSNTVTSVPEVPDYADCNFHLFPFLPSASRLQMLENFLET